MHIEIESLSANRTISYFRDLNAPETYWSVEVLTESNARSYYTVTRDGWVVAEMTAREVHDSGNVRASQVFHTMKPSETIPACVLSHLPTVAT